MIKEGTYTLRWGHRIKGMFTIAEGYHQKARYNKHLETKKWESIWKTKTWPKVELFTWILSHGRALTWDQLRKKGMQGPSRCALYREQEETMEHLTNTCKVNGNLWRQHQRLSKISDRDINSMKIMIENSRNKPYQNMILNKAWRLSIGFVLWNIWKERNRLIFKEVGRENTEVWNQII